MGSSKGPNDHANESRGVDEGSKERKGGVLLKLRTLSDEKLHGKLNVEHKSMDGPLLEKEGIPCLSLEWTCVENGP
ncbi:hypothetical protein CEXT_333391 [Caerostris extrusa]|uniref:Uncharacterized protein n=1 Tax=Caerostris extrusa TaxID=172846 RepID=A0AAV4UT74_CAEEX|nr:hypothetical protein CEXT_333391 [Caerostris extrusa]